MSKELTVEQVREKPEELLEAIEKREEVTITRDGSAVATVRPEGLRIVQRGTPYPFRNLQITPLSKPLDVDPVAELIAERDHERSGKK